MPPLSFTLKGMTVCVCASFTFCSFSDIFIFPSFRYLIATRLEKNLMKFIKFEWTKDQNSPAPPPKNPEKKTNTQLRFESNFNFYRYKHL